MASSSFSLLLLFSAAAFAMVAAIPPDANIDLPTNYVKHMNFFFHEKVVGTPNATSTFAVNMGGNGGFGSIKVYDNALRVTKELDSPSFGRAQGIGAFSDLTADPIGGATMMNLVFTSGKYNGSALAVVGLYRLKGVSERSIVGGGGKFHMARGYLYSWVVSPPGATTTVVEFDIYLTELGTKSSAA